MRNHSSFVMHILAFAAAMIALGLIAAHVAICANSAPAIYTDGKLTVEWTQTDQDFSGTMTLGTQQFPATAHAGSDGIKGSFVSGTNRYPFVGSIDGDMLTLSTGGATYRLKNQSLGNPLAPQNPLAAANGAAPASGSASAADLPAGYTLVSSTDSGKAFSVQKAGATTIEAALESTLPDLARYFGSKPAVGAAYQDAKDPKSGGATFSATSAGQPVKGIISCKVGEKGAAVAVIYARADISKADWNKLIAPPAISDAPPTAGNTPTAAVPQQPAFPLHEFDFPDGSGSLELADGWTTPNQTCINPVLITGPAQQSIVLNNIIRIDTPDSSNQRMRQQNQRMQAQLAANARAQGRTFIPMPALPGPPPLVAPYCEPVDALKTMVPQMSAASQFNHGPATTLDKIISVKDAPAALPGGKGAIIEYTFTQTRNGEQTQFRRSIYLQTTPAGQTSWTWIVSGVAAPASTFDGDKALMFAMLNSLKINQAQWTKNLNAQTQTNLQNIKTMGDAQNQMLQTTAQMGRDNAQTQNNIYQQQHQAQMDGYAQHNQQWAADETRKQQATADFIETIKGTRMVYDTQTGQSADVNLNYVTGVVDSLNQAALDPNRFVQVPLRDYLYAPTPVPGR